MFLTKLTGTNVEITYNLMRTMIAAFAFVLPFSLIRQMLKDRMKLKNHREWIAEAGGILAGIGVSMSGNLHYIIYGVILRLLKIREDYWFPDSTRYIGFDPAVEGDETIHEFPSYSFVLGDLHAHVINVFLVLLVLGILYAWIKTNKEKKLETEGDWSSWSVVGNVFILQYLGFHDLLCCDLWYIVFWKFKKI